MDVLKFEMKLMGDQSKAYNDLKHTLQKSISRLKLPIKIREFQTLSLTEIVYRDEHLVFNTESSFVEEQKLNDFLSKINPKSGKICKCSDCKNCPSKRLKALLLK